jgi:hypothetical protein
VSPSLTTAKSKFAALVAAALGAALWLSVAAGDHRTGGAAYLSAWLYLLSITLGSQVLLWLHNLTGGQWGRAARPTLQAAASLVPLVALAFVPIALEVRTIYHWAAEEGTTTDPILLHKSPWLNVQGFQIRAAVYFALWILGGLYVRAAERRAARASNEAAARRIRVRSAQAIGAYGLSMTFASVDWAMSLDPHWYSAAYGVIFVIGQGLSALAFQTLMTARRSGVELAIAGAPPNKEQDSAAHQSPPHDPSLQHSPHAHADQTHSDDHHATPLQDLGNLLLAFTMLWAYVSFSQFLIIWFGDLPEEVVWYLKRFHGGWQAVAWALLLFHFGLPFFALMRRQTKRDPRAVGAVASGMLLMRAAELVWQVEPEFGPVSVRALAATLGALLLLGGLGFAAFQFMLGRTADGSAANHLAGGAP